MRALLILLPIALALAGCAAEPDTSTTTPETTPTATTPLATTPTTTTPTGTTPVTSTPTSTTPTTTTPTGADDTQRVEIVGFRFSPVDLTVAAGTTVAFRNLDGATHTATADDGSFDSGNLREDTPDFEVTLTTPGTVSYHCKIHPSMKGTITVTA